MVSVHALNSDILSSAVQQSTAKLNGISTVAAVILIFILVALAFLSKQK